MGEGGMRDGERVRERGRLVLTTVISCVYT